MGSRNPRTQRLFDELQKSIAAVGLLNPIVITTDKTLVAGLHRLRACEALRLPLRVRAAPTTPQCLATTKELSCILTGGPWHAARSLRAVLVVVTR